MRVVSGAKTYLRVHISVPHFAFKRISAHRHFYLRFKVHYESKILKHFGVIWTFMICACN